MDELMLYKRAFELAIETVTRNGEEVGIPPTTEMVEDDYLKRARRLIEEETNIG